MRRRVRGSMPDQFELNLTPLLDVILQLITFFMMLVHFGTRIEGDTQAVRLPVAPAALPSGDLGMDRLVVAINREGQLLFDGGIEAGSWWKSQARKRLDARRILGGKGGRASHARGDPRRSRRLVWGGSQDPGRGAIRRIRAFQPARPAGGTPMTRRSKRAKLPEEVAFPVTPFLDMAFQLLAFFILTFRAESGDAARSVPARHARGVAHGRRGGSCGRTPSRRTLPTWRPTSSSGPKATSAAACCCFGWGIRPSWTRTTSANVCASMRPS